MEMASAQPSKTTEATEPDWMKQALKQAAMLLPGHAHDEMTSARDHTPRPDASPEWQHGESSGFQAAAQTTPSNQGLIKQVQGIVQQPRVGLMHVESRLLVCAAGEAVGTSGAPLGGADPEHAPVANLRELDVAANRWKLEAYSTYADGYPRLVMIRNDLVAQLSLSLAHSTRLAVAADGVAPVDELCLRNTATPSSRNMWEIQYAPAHGGLIDTRMLSLRLAVRSARSGAIMWRYLGCDGPGRVVVSSEPQFFALVDMQPALSEVGVGLKVLGAAGVTGVVGKFASGFNEVASSGVTDGALDSLVGQAEGSGAAPPAIGLSEGASEGAAGSEAATTLQAPPAATEAAGDGAPEAFAAGAASAEAARAVRLWLPWLIGLPAFLEAVTRCHGHLARSCTRCAKLYGYSRLSTAARWNFEYVRSMCSDPRDVSVYVWGFPAPASQGEAQPGPPPGDD